MFSFTFTQNDLFLKLMYRAFSQRRFQYKLLTLPLKCDLERDLQPILYTIYKKNLELESQDYKITRQEFLRATVDFLEIIKFLNYHPFRKNKDGYVFNHH